MSLTLLNSTHFSATFIVHKGDLPIPRLPSLSPGGALEIPTDSYSIVASTIIDGNTYTTAPQLVQGAAGFIAQVIQVPQQGTYEFDIQVIASRAPNTLTFQKTCLNPVTFVITRNGEPMQTVVVQNAFDTKTVKLPDTLAVYAIMNGITTDTLVTPNTTTVITALEENIDGIPSFWLLAK